MQPEQLPENKGGRPPPQLASPEDVWQIKEGEMTPQESRTLGHLLYVGIFTRLPQPVVDALEADHNTSISARANQFEEFDIRTVHAEKYVETYAEVYRLSTSLLKRWTHQASVEIADVSLPVLQRESKALAKKYGWSRRERIEHHEAIIQPVATVGKYGLQAAVQDHRGLVAEAFYMGRDFDALLPLNFPLVAGVLGKDIFS